MVIDPQVMTNATMDAAEPLASYIIST